MTRTEEYHELDAERKAENAKGTQIDPIMLAKLAYLSWQIHFFNPFLAFLFWPIQSKH